MNDDVPPVELPAVDDPPARWGPDHDDLVATPVDVEIGNRLGATINVDDDSDAGDVA